MKFDPRDPATWPSDNQDVQVWSSESGFTHATFYPAGEDGHEQPGFGNWFDRLGDGEDADYAFVRGEVHWWPLPDPDAAARLA